MAATDFSLHCSVQIGCGAHSVYYSVGKQGLFPRK